MDVLIIGLVLGAIIIAAMFFGGVIGFCVGKKEQSKTDDFFLRRHNYYGVVQDLEKKLEDEKRHSNNLHQDNIALRLKLGSKADEVEELRVRLRRAELGRERKNHGK